MYLNFKNDEARDLAERSFKVELVNLNFRFLLQPNSDNLWTGFLRPEIPCKLTRIMERNPTNLQGLTTHLKLLMETALSGMSIRPS